MNWAEERFVKVYTRDSGDWLRLGWEAQALFLMLLRKVDRAGVIELGKSGVHGLADMLRMPIDVLEPALERLCEDGCVTRCHATSQLVVPNFAEAQATRQTPRQRQHESRARKRDVARHAQSLDASHTVSPGGSNGHSENRTEQNRSRSPLPPAVPDAAAKPPGVPDPGAEEPPPPTEPPGWLAAGSTSPVREPRRAPPAYPQKPVGGYVPGSVASTPRCCARCSRTGGALLELHGRLLCNACYGLPPPPRPSEET